MKPFFIRRMFINPGLEETDDLQRKIAVVSPKLERLLSESAAKRMLVAYRDRLSRSRLESDHEYMKDIADFCAKYVDLLTLLACLASVQEWKVDSLFVLMDFARQKLVEHKRQHSLAMVSTLST